MPTYEYECTKCGHNFEAFQKITDEPLDKCPKCGKRAKRLISCGAGIIFKGSGFYATDYRKKSPPQKAGESKGDTCAQPKEGCEGCPRHLR